MGYFIKKAIDGSEGLIISGARRPVSPVKGLIRFNNATNALEYFNGTVYVELAKVGGANLTVDSFVADGVATEYNGMSQAPLSETDIIVFVNGIHQEPITHYSVTGVNITFTDTPPANVSIAVVHNVSSTYVTDSNVYDVPNL